MPQPAHFTQFFQTMAQRRILVVGDVMLDHFIWGAVRRISPEAPVPIVNPLFPALRSSPTAVQEPPAKSKFLAVFSPPSGLAQRLFRSLPPKANS